MQVTIKTEEKDGKISSTTKDIEIRPLTRGMSKQITAALLKGVKVEADENGQTKMSGVPMENEAESKDIAVSLRTGLTMEEVSSLLDKDFTAIQVAIYEFDQAEKKSETTSEIESAVS